MYLSVVIPICNEFKNIPHCYRNVTRVLDQLGRRYEIVFVDDGSQDRSDQRLEELARQDGRLPSKIANWLIARVTGFQVRDLGCTLNLERDAPPDDGDHFLRAA